VPNPLVPDNIKVAVIKASRRSASSIYEAYNPAIAQVDAEHVFSVAEFDVMKNGMAPEAAILRQMEL
jgi:hypothetical protein